MVGKSGKKDTVVESQGALRGPDSTPEYTVKHQFFMLQA